MRFDDLDKRMRIFETSHDHKVLPGMYMVARIDGRSFTRLTKEILNFDAPFDIRFRDYMIKTTEHLMNCGFKIIYAYTQSDEISLLFHINENTFSRKLRKYDSVLAGEASARFSLLSGTHACFDSRISQLPRIEDVIDYFRWRQEDALRNSLNSYCYWTLRNKGENATKASKQLERLSVSEKNELLFNLGVNFNYIPIWQKRGAGLYWITKTITSHNPINNIEVSVDRQRLQVDFELPTRDLYNNFVNDIILRNSGDK